MADIIEFKPKAKEEDEGDLIFTCNCGSTLYEFIPDAAVCYRCGCRIDKWPTIEEYD